MLKEILTCMRSVVRLPGSQCVLSVSLSVTLGVLLEELMKHQLSHFIVQSQD